MPQINDCIVSVTGGPTTNEGLLAFYKANGATSNNLQDAAREFLLARGVPSGQLQDMWRSFLSGLGIPDGHLNDMLYEYWCVRNGPVP